MLNLYTSELSRFITASLKSISLNNAGQFNLKIMRYAIESTDLYLLKLGKNLSKDFEIVYIFRTNAVLNICRYLERFYSYQKKKNFC